MSMAYFLGFGTDERGKPRYGVIACTSTNVSVAYTGEMIDVDTNNSIIYLRGTMHSGPHVRLKDSFLACFFGEKNFNEEFSTLVLTKSWADHLKDISLRGRPVQSQGALTLPPCIFGLNVYKLLKGSCLRVHLRDNRLQLSYQTPLNGSSFRFTSSAQFKLLKHWGH